MSDVTPLQLLSVQVGPAAPLPIGDRSVMSGIRKHPVTGPVAVRPLGLAGDEQADLTVHGGLWKAVYAYPVEHYEYWREWRRSFGFPDDLPFGTLGENLTIQGLLETELFVGDCLRFPECELRVTQPRMPCYKFVAVMGDAQAARAMVRTGFCGFYLAADQPGQLQAGQSFELVPGPRELPLMDLFPKARQTD